MNKRKVLPNPKLETYTDKQLLYYYMRRNGYTVATLARKIGISGAALVGKAGSKHQFTAKEIIQLSNVLHMSLEDVGKIFLCIRS